MANPVGFDGANEMYLAPPDSPQNEYGDLPAFVDNTQVISCWRLTEKELEEVRSTGVVWLSVKGHLVPPLLVSGKALVELDGVPSRAEPYIPPAPRTKG